MEESIAFKLKSKSLLKEISILNLKRGAYQPRENFPLENLNSLAETIKHHGVLQPLIVRPLNDVDYEIIAGERRWRAAQLAGLHSIPCIVNNCTDEQAARIALIENTHRENLNIISEARAILRMVEEFGYTHEEMAAAIGKPRTVITNLLRLLKLDERVQKILIAGELTEAHAKLLAGLPICDQYPLAIQALKKTWSVKSLESFVKNRLGSISNSNLPKKDIYVAKIEQQLSEQYGHQIVLNINKEKSGSLNFCFKNFDELQWILDKLDYLPDTR